MILRHLYGMLVLLLVEPTVTRAETLTFCHSPMPPYSIDLAPQPADGIKVRILNDVMDRIENLSAEVVFLPWARCLAYAISGEVDGILPLFRNAEREAYLAFSQPVFTQDILFWYRRENFPDGLDWSGDFAELVHLRLGLLNGGYLSAEMEDAFAASDQVQQVGSLDALMRMVVEDRVDLFATDAAIGRQIAARNGWQGVVASVARPITSPPTQFGLSRASGAAQYTPQFDAEIDAMRRDGRITQRLTETNFEF